MGRKDTELSVVSKNEFMELLEGVSPCYLETIDSKEVKNIKALIESAPSLRENYLIDEKYYCVVYITKTQVEYDFFGVNSQTESQKVKVCAIYDKDLNFLTKGKLQTVASFMGITSSLDYLDVSNIEKKPKLFLEIYKQSMCQRPHDPSPQQLADMVLSDCKNGEKYAQFLRKPKNPLLMVCEKEGLTRSELAERIGITVLLFENCLSRGKCSKGVLEKLRKVYKYV